MIRNAPGGLAHEGVRRPEHPQRGGGGPRRLRKDLARVRPALRRRHRQPDRSRRRRHDGDGLRSRRDRAKDQPARGARVRGVEEDQGQPDRRARLRELPVRGARGVARGRSGARRGRRGGGHRGADAEGLGLRRGGRAGASDRRQPHGPRQRLVRARARRNPEVLRPLRGADRDTGRRGQGAQGRRRPRRGEGAPLRRRR